MQVEDTLTLLWRGQERIFTRVPEYDRLYKSNNVYIAAYSKDYSSLLDWWSARTTIRFANYGIGASGASAQEALSTLESSLQEINSYWD